MNGDFVSLLSVGLGSGLVGAVLGYLIATRWLDWIARRRGDYDWE